LFRKKWLGTVAVSLLLLAAVAGCGHKAGPQAASSAVAPIDNLSGALKIAAPVSAQALSAQLADAFEKLHPQVKISVASGPAVSGIREIQTGTADIGAVTRALTDQEQSTVKATLIAMDGVVIIVHPSNGVTGLTLDQAKGIFDGRITNWQNVGGSNSTIDLFTRERGAGTRSMIQDKVMGSDKISPGAGIQTSTEGIRDAVAGDNGAIGYISLGELDQSVKALAIQGVMPNMQTVYNGSYGISRPILYVTKGDPQGLTKAFIDYVLSPAGQSIIAGMKLINVK
jgi:phosphate transport system substrate-binding protein